MHHHHPAPLLTTTPGMGLTTGNSSQQQQQQRRRKKRPNYGTRTVEVRRGYNGFGFTISGQQPCRLSCIVQHSPADEAGLRAGDFLISVNGLNVSKLPHETVVQLIGNSFGSIRMQIAENYYSDSSDEENAAALLQQSVVGVASVVCRSSGFGIGAGVGAQLNLNASVAGARPKPRYLHHKAKMHRLRNSPQKKRSVQPAAARERSTLTPSMSKALELQTLRPLMEELPLAPPAMTANRATSNMPAAPMAVSSAVANVSAMVRVPTAATTLEYRAIVGYLGTIEMPKQISVSSKLQTVRSCIRKLRQEKRQPTTVLVTILPDCLRLQSANGNVLASYASERLNYVSSSSESENRFFGLVTSAVHTAQADEEDDDDEEARAMGVNGLHGADVHMASNAGAGHISISNSCHVFVIDTKLCDHEAHMPRATEFRIHCTRDPISSLCLEFPNNSEYVVNLIRSMYTMRILPPATKYANHDDAVAPPGAAAAHSPQPSNHSEISTTTSNSDSGIGFHNDCSNISDRILVVDFPGLPELRARPPMMARPLGIFNNLDEATAALNDQRLTVRAMPDPKSPLLASPPPPPLPVHLRARPNLLASFSLIKSPASSLTATRSCDDVLALTAAADDNDSAMLPPYASMDDISLHSTAATLAAVDRQHHFLQPTIFADNRANRNLNADTTTYSLLQDYRSGMRSTRHSLQAVVPSKLSPQVYGHQKRPPVATVIARKSTKTRHSLAFDALPVRSNAATLLLSPLSPKHEPAETWSSLVDLGAGVPQRASHNTTSAGNNMTLDITNSEPDLGHIGNTRLPYHRALVPGTRPLAASFRSPRTEKTCLPGGNLSPLVRRSTSMHASDTDVYRSRRIDNNNSSSNSSSASELLSKAQECNGNMPSRINNNNITINANSKDKSNSSDILIQQKMPPPTTAIKTKQAAEEEVDLCGGGGVTSWGAAFEYLLTDPAGLQTFAEFLKKEFSAENIYFWTACERFRHLPSAVERAEQARLIYNKHLANSSNEPVNVDSRARRLTPECLQLASADLFAAAQKQIFNLMKFDSYQRFIRSDLYKSCLEAEEKGRALPYGANSLEKLLRINFPSCSSANLKKTSSNAEDSRRKSLLPWHRKSRSKSREAIAADASDTSKAQSFSSSSRSQLTAAAAASDVHSSRSSISSLDGYVSGMSIEAAGLCRVILSDGATTMVLPRANETVAQLVERLLEKRCLDYKFYDLVDSASSESINLQKSARSLIGREVLLEQGVAFKIDLPDPKVISVRSKPKKQLQDVIRPILLKYNYAIDAVQVLVQETQTPLDLSLPVTVANGLRLQISLSTPCSQLNGGAAPSKLKKSTQQSTLDEITNKVFNELLQGKVQQPQKGGGKAADLCSIKSEECASEGSSTLSHLRKRSDVGVYKKTKVLKSSSQSQVAAAAAVAAASIAFSVEDLKKPIIAKLKAGAKLQMPERVAEAQDELLEGLKRAQLARLEDQRGTEINSELPEFLRNSAAASKLRKLRANLSPIIKTTTGPNTSLTTTNPTTITLDAEPETAPTFPQPAPRLSITKRSVSLVEPSVSPMKVDDTESLTLGGNSSNSSSSSMDSIEFVCARECPSPVAETAAATPASSDSGKGPPPLPPKPKVVPIKPSNWATTAEHGSTTTRRQLGTACLSKGHVALAVGQTTAASATTRCAYLEEPSSSFV